MKVRSYNKEIRNITAQFTSMFNDIVIDRRDKDGNVQKTFKVACVYGGKRRALKRLEDRDGTIPLPLIIININRVARDSGRSFGVHDDLLQEDGTGSLAPSDRTPAPIDLTYEVEILAKYQDDLDMIIGNFVPYFLPNAYIVVPNPYSASKPLKLNVIWEGDFSIDLDSECAPDKDERMYAATSFTVKGWLFPGMADAHTEAEHKTIKRINFNQNLGNEEVIYYGAAKNPMLYGAGESTITRYIGLEQSFFDVPSAMPFATFRANVLSGYVDPASYDHIAISANLPGYWQDISGAISGSYNMLDVLSSDWNIYSNENDNLILFSGNYMNADMKDVSFDAWWEFHKETVSGDLSTYYTSG